MTDPEALILAHRLADVPPHPYWCDECGGKAPFALRECPIEHKEDCPRFGEDANAVWLAAYEYVRDTGRSIP